MTPEQHAVNAEKERLCLTGIDLADMYSDGMPATDIVTLALDDADLAGTVEGLLLYALMLEAVIHQKAAVPPAELRAASREMAKTWRARARVTT